MNRLEGIQDEKCQDSEMPCCSQRWITADSTVPRMATPRLVMCLILQIVSALSAPTLSFGNSDSSSVSNFEERKAEEAVLRKLEKSVEYSKELSQILKKIASYITAQFTDNNQLDDLKCEIRTHEIHKNFVFYELKGKIFPSKNPVYSTVVQPSIGTKKYLQIIPEISEPRSHFGNGNAYTPEKYRKKNSMQMDNKNTLNDPPKEVFSVTNITKNFHHPFHENENPTSIGHALDNPGAKKVNDSQNIRFNNNNIYDLNNGTVGSINTHSNEHEQFFTTNEGRLILTEQTATDQDFDSNSVESAMGSLYIFENSTESVFSSKELKSYHSLLHPTLAGSIQRSSTSNKSETIFHKSTFTRNGTKNMQGNTKVPEYQNFQIPTTVNKKEVWPSKYNESSEEGTESSSITKRDENLTLKRAFSESTKNKPFELTLTSIDKEHTTTQGYYQPFNLTELYITKPTEVLTLTSSESLDNNSSNNNQNSSFYSETNNYTVLNSKLLTTDHKSNHSTKKLGTSTIQNINPNFAGPSQTTSLNLNPISTTIAYLLTDDSDSVENTTDVTNSQSILQSRMSFSSLDNSDFFTDASTAGIYNSSDTNSDYTIFTERNHKEKYTSHKTKYNDSDLFEKDKESTVIITKEDYSNTDHKITETQFTEIPSINNLETTIGKFTKNLSAPTMFTMEQTMESEDSDSNQTLTSEDPTLHHDFTKVEKRFLTVLDLVSLVTTNYSKSITTSLPDQQGSYSMNTSQTLDKDSNESKIKEVSETKSTTHKFEIFDDKLSNLNMNGLYTTSETAIIDQTAGLKHDKILNETITPNYYEESSNFSNEISTNNYEIDSYINSMNTSSREITDIKHNTVELTLNPSNYGNETFNSEAYVTNYSYNTKDPSSSPTVTDIYNLFTYSETKFDVSDHTEKSFSPPVTGNSYLQASNSVNNFKQETTQLYNANSVTSQTFDDQQNDEISNYTNDISEEAVTLSRSVDYTQNVSKDIYEIKVTTQKTNEEYHETSKTELNGNDSFINSLSTEATTDKITKNPATYAQSSSDGIDKAATENIRSSQLDVIVGNNETNSNSISTTKLNVEHMSRQYNTLPTILAEISDNARFNDSIFETSTTTHPGTFENGNSTISTTLNFKETVDITTVALPDESSSLYPSNWNLSTITSYTSTLQLINEAGNFRGTINNNNIFQTTTEIPSEVTSTSNHIENKIETKPSFTHPPTETSTIIHLGTYNEDISKSYSTLNITDSIDITSTSTYKETDFINSYTKNKNNSMVNIFNNPKIYQYSEEIFSETTALSNITEFNSESTLNFGTYTQLNELANSSKIINNSVMPYNDIYTDKYNSMNSNINGITKKESGMLTTTKSENAYNVETNAQHHKFTKLKHDPSYSEILDDEITMHYSTPNVLNTMEIATDKNNEQTTAIDHLLTEKTAEGIVHTTIASHIFNIDNSLSTNISTLQGSNTTESPMIALNETTTLNSSNSEDLHEDEINIYDETTPYFNNFTFYLPTTNQFHIRYIPVRVFPLFTLTQIK